MKITIFGGGGFRVPMVYEALLGRAERLGLDEVALYEVDETRLRRIAPVLEGLQQSAGRRLAIRPTVDLDEALEGADFIFSAIRVGQLEGRVIDEAVPQAAGVVGQETTGPGGIGFALRTVPVMRALATAVARRAPRAWFINFTNPAGLVTEAIGEILGHRAIGICDSPAGLGRRVAAALGRPEADLAFDYFGLNHLGWLRAVHDGTTDLLPGLLADDAALDGLLEGRLFGSEWLRTIRMIPNEYLYFYTFATDTVEALRAGAPPRAEFLLRQQRAFYSASEASPEVALAAWRATRLEREETYFAEAKSAAGVVEAAPDPDTGGGYEGIALAVVEAIALDQLRVLILNTPNRSALPFLDERSVVEVPCVVGRSGVSPLAVGAVPAHARLLIETIKEVERLTIRAAIERSRLLAVEALALHPLVPSVTIARRIFDDYRAQQPELRDWPA